jgi:hypothetical protein
MAEKRVIELEVKTTGAENSEKSVKSLKAQLRDLKNELAGLDEGSERFKEVAKQAGALQDKIGDANQQVKLFASDTRKLDGAIGGIQAVAGGFGAVTSSMALVGVESEELEKTMMKLQGAMTLVTSIQSVANALNKDSAFMSLVQTTRTNLLTKATVQQAVATGTATTAQKIMNAVMKANPIFLVIGGIAALVGAYVALTSSTEKQYEVEKKLSELRRKERERTNKDISVQQQKERMQKGGLYDLQNELKLLESKNASEKDIFEKKKQIIQEEINLVNTAARLRTKLNEKGILELGKLSREEFLIRKNLEVELEVLENEFRNRKKEKTKKEKKELKQIEEDFYKGLIDTVKLNEEAYAEAVAEARNINIESYLSEEEKEIRAIELKYAKIQELGDLNKDLEEARLNELNEIRTKFAKQEIAEKEQEDAKKIAQEQALRDARFMIAQDTLNGLNAIGNAFIKDQKKLEKFNKATALVQIGIDTAKAISSLVAASNANPLNAPTAGGAGIAQLVSGLASILTNIAKAKQILSSSGSSAPSGGSGGGSTASPQQQVTPPSFNIVGQSGVNTLGQQTQPLQAYVVSGEMTSQQALDRNRLKNATFG